MVPVFVLTGRTMESETTQSVFSRKTLEYDITRGMEQVKQLRMSSSGKQESALERMLASYEEAPLSILKEIASDGQGQSVVSPSSDTPGASMSINKVQCEDSNTISIPPLDNELRRSYYRCVCRFTHDCPATKALQRSDKDPSTFEVAYSGKNTCIGQAHVVPQRVPKSTVCKPT
ncbi:hypothetical protein CDL12_17826 [Handroanthus impetiginosus]|uniref:WRKY domain-containing protein n=1 Tax=Handroanthus impetiginosus TaxID=429701 RepID=A0A2G9GWE0_9LAMI|nr:hypothetical protein CDL12_17826 [Handroanthus impetiginosus]